MSDDGSDQVEVERGEARGADGREPARAEQLASLRAENERLRRELSSAQATNAKRGDRRSATASSGELPSDAAERLALLEAMVETVPVGIVLADAQGRIVYGNAEVERMLRHPVLHSPDPEAYDERVSFHPDGSRVQGHEYPLSRVIRDGEDHAALDVCYRRGDGSKFWMRIVGEPVCDENGSRVGATVALIDIDDEKRLLDEKEVLLGEVNHRVKNSLQLVSAILALQARDAEGDAARALQSSAARVRAVAAVHASLYHDDDVRTVDFGMHLREFCATLADSLGADERGIALDVETEAIQLQAEKAVPLSLMVNELVANAFKYAFPTDAKGSEPTSPRPQVRVSLYRHENREVVLEVSDNGAGSGTKGDVEPFGDQPNTKSGSLEWSASGGLGTTLVTTLARQIGAHVTREEEEGWAVRIAFEV